MLFLLHFLNGWVRFDKKGNAIYPPIVISLIACTSGLAWRMLAVYSIIDVKKLFFIATVFYSAYFQARAALDSAVDKLYRKTAFPDDAACAAFLFELYGKKPEGFDFAC